MSTSIFAQPNTGTAPVLRDEFNPALLQGAADVRKCSIVWGPFLGLEIRKRGGRHFRPLCKLVAGPSQHCPCPTALMSGYRFFV